MWYVVSEESLHTYEASGLSHSEGFTNYSVDLASAPDWDEGSGYSAIVIDDLDRIVKVAGALRAYGKEYQLKGEETTSLSDLRNGPSIFIGAFDNSWTLRFTKGLRYHFANNPDMCGYRYLEVSI